MIRKMIRADIDDVHNLHSKVAKHKITKRMMGTLFNQINVEALISEIADEDSNDRAIIGYLFALKDGYSAQIIDIAVDPLCQGTGHARALINSLGNYVGADISLEAVSDEHCSGFFEKCGFKRVRKYGEDKYLYRSGWRFAKGKSPQVEYRNIT